jgi:hypothetical protein
MVQVVKYLSTKLEVLSSNPGAAKHMLLIKNKKEMDKIITLKDPQVYPHIQVPK